MVGVQQESRERLKEASYVAWEVIEEEGLLDNLV